MNSRVLAQNLRRFRMGKRLSQKKLAELAGLSLPSIQNLEREIGKNPRMKTIRSIAKALNVPLHNLFIPVREMKAVRFRSSKKMRSRESILTAASWRLDNFNYLEEVVNDKRPFLLKKVIDQCSQQDPVTAAYLCRSALNLSRKEPIHDICGLLEYAGVKVLPIELASEGFFGLSVAEDDGGPAVVVNTWKRIPIERWIFSAVHELGHLVLHRDAFNIEEIDENNEEEHQADSFAAHFLLPDDGFKSEWNDAAGLHWIDAVFKVKRIFNVSYKTVLHRLIEYDVFDKSIWMTFNMAYRSRYGNSLPHKKEPDAIGSSEPFSMKLFEFFEDRLSRLTRRAVENEIVSLSRGAEILNISVGEMRDLLTNWAAVL